MSRQRRGNKGKITETPYRHSNSVKYVKFTVTILLVIYT